MLHIFFASVGFLIILGITELFRGSFQFTTDLTRKIGHMLSGVYIFFLPYFLNKTELIILSLLFVGILFVTKTLKIFQSIHGVSRKTWGEIYFPLSLGILAFFFLPDHILSAQFGVLVLGFSDALASIIGIEYGSHEIKIFGHKKSLEGSAAFFLTTCILICAFLPGGSFSFYGIAIFAAFFLTCIELVSKNGLDNLFLPVISSFLFQYLLLALH